MKLQIKVLDNNIQLLIDNNPVLIQNALLINKRLFYVRELERLYDVYYNNPVLKKDVSSIISVLKNGLKINTVKEVLESLGLDFNTPPDDLSSVDLVLLERVYKISKYNAPREQYRNNTVLYYFYNYILKYINNELDARSIEVNELESI